jgi:O-antigen/teichoic acid export membrane protein
MLERQSTLAQLLRNFLALGAGNYGAMAVSLGINAMLTHRLGAEQFGHLALLLTASQVLALVVANWTHTALVRFGAQEYVSATSVAGTFWTRIWIVAPWFAVASALMLAEAPRVTAYLMIPTWGIFAVLAHFTATFMLLTIGAVFQATGEMRRYGIVLFLDKTVMAVLLVVFFPASWIKNPLAILWLYAASSTAVAAWGLARIRVKSLLPVRFDRDTYNRMFAFSFPLLLSSWVGLFGTNWFDILILRKYRPLSEVGLYSLGSVLAGVVQQVTIIFSTLLLPQLSVMVSNGELDKIRTFANRLLPYWFLGTAALFMLVVLMARPMVPLIFGRAFAPAASVLAILMVATCALALFNAFSPLMTAFGATWALTGIGLTSGVVNVVMDLILIPRYGIRGAAFATVLAYGTSALLVLAYVQRRLNQNVFRLALLAVPVLGACVCFLFLGTMPFYAAACSIAAISGVWLTRRFRLFRSDDAVFLAPWGLGGLFRRIS